MGAAGAAFAPAAPRIAARTAERPRRLALRGVAADVAASSVTAGRGVPAQRRPRLGPDLSRGRYQQLRLVPADCGGGRDVLAERGTGRRQRGGTARGTSGARAARGAAGGGLVPA